MVFFTKRGSTSSIIDEHTLLLIHGDSIEDKSSYKNPIENNGVKVRTDNSNLNNGSLFFNGSSWLKTTDFDFKDQDFTIEWWEYISGGYPGSRFSSSFAETYGGYAFGGPNDSNQLYMTSTQGTSSGWDMFLGAQAFDSVNAQWVHRAFVRSDNAFISFKNGVQIWSANFLTAKKSIFNNGAGLVIGRFTPSDITQYFHGYMDEIRVSDVARWDKNFSVPQKPYRR